MAANNQEYITTVKINDSQAQQKLESLKEEAKGFRQEMNKAYSEGNTKLGDELKKKLSATEKEMHKLTLETMDVEKILNNLSDASINQLNKAAKSLRAQMKNLSTSSEEFKQKAEQLKNINTQLANVRSGFRESESWTDKLANGFNKWQGAVLGAVGALTGLTMTIRKSVQDYADMEEAMANVRKYTGWTDEQIRDFNEDLKKMDTRTSREDLNALAGDAGRLGITSKEMVGEFVDAADKINVALGDDLGDDAVATVGKLAQTFGDSDKMGLRGAMLATGSAVNELAASSSASAGYVVDFTSRLAGVATQAGLSQTEIMGLAAVLDSNMQQCETSSTALSQLISKMYQEPAKFAKLAGADVEQFTSLLKTDANGALMQFLQTMQSKGGFDALAPMFQEMGLSGTRCVGVLSTLAMHLDEVKNQQDIAATAFKDGTSVLNEFNTQNNTVQAGIDKAQKAFHEVSVELGEKLQPVVKYTISSASLLVKGLSALVDIFAKCGTTIVAVSAIIAAYMIQQKAQNALFKVQYAWLVLTEAWHKKNGIAMMFAAAKQKALNVIMKANPYALAISAITILVGLYYDWARSSDKVRKNEEMMLDIQQEANKNYQEEANKVEVLNKIIHDNSLSIAERRGAIKDLQEIVPEYHASLTDEGKLINDNTNALDTYCKKLKLTAQIQAASSKLTDVEERKSNFERNTPNNLTQALFNERVEGMDEGQAAGKAGASLVAYRAWKAQAKELQNEQDYLTKTIEGYTKEMAKIHAAEPSKGNGSAGGGGTTPSQTSSSSSSSTDNATKEALAKSKQLMAEELAATELSYNHGEMLYSQYMQKKYDIQKAELEREKSNYKEGTAEYNNVLIEEQKLDDKHNEYKRKARLEELDQEEVYAKRYIELNVTDEDRKEEELFQIHQTYQQMRLEQMTVNTKEYDDLQKEMFEEQEQHKFDLQMKWVEKAQQFKEQYIPQSDEEIYQLELKLADELHQRGLLSDEEYQKALKEIKDKYEKKKAEDTKKVIEDAKAELEGIGDGLQFDSLGKALENLKDKLKTHSADWKDYAKVATVALQAVTQMMSSISSYVQASAEAEIAVTEAKYDKLIDAAEGNEEEQERLEEEKTKKTNEIKAKAYKSERDINVATALINVALGITKGYAEYGPIVGSVLAALTTAMGVLEIATINKNYEAQIAALQSSGYYEGGYTGGKRYHEEAGVVHQGEFVANHEAVNNPTLSPVLDLIDQAQQNNTVGSLTSDDLRSAITGGNVQTIAPIVNVNTDNSDLKASMGEMSSAVKELNRQLDNGLHTNLSMTEFKKAEKHYDNLMSNK